MEREDNASSNKRSDGRGKPTRLTNNSFVRYPLSPSNILFRHDTISGYICMKYGNRFSRFQYKVFLVFCELMPMLDAVSLSYHQVDKSGMVRGMNWEDIARSLVVLADCGVLEAFGLTQGEKHYKYRLSVDGERLHAWILAELECPKDTLLFNSKRFIVAA